MTVRMSSSAAASKTDSGLCESMTGAWPEGAVTPAAVIAERNSGVLLVNP